jgi:BirA family transcriptional regulator, biotin operon repressor / biotin---[acetyl-CoA-carboxylase] ligase
VPSRNEIAIVEKQTQFAIGAGRAVAAVHQVSPDRLREVRTNGARGGGERIGRPDELPAPVDDALTLDRHCNDRSARDEAHEIVKECLSQMLRVMLPRTFAVELHQFHRRDHVASPLEPRGNLADQAAGNRVGFAKNQRTFDGHKKRSFSVSIAGPYSSVVRDLAGTEFSSIRYVEETESTNADAAALLGDEAYAGLTIVAEYQSRGAGRKGRSWQAAAGSALLFSTILPNALSTQRLWIVPFWAALSIRAALSEFGVVTTLQWPNDILLGERKIAGILCQSSVTGSRAWVACGAGINVRRWHDASTIVPPPAFCDDVATIDRAALMRSILNEYDRSLRMLDDEQGIAARWNDAAGLPGRRYRIVRDDDPTPFDAIAQSLSQGGGLEVIREDGRHETIALADARVVR